MKRIYISISFLIFLSSCALQNQNDAYLVPNITNSYIETISKDAVSAIKESVPSLQTCFIVPTDKLGISIIKKLQNAGYESVAYEIKSTKNDIVRLRYTIDKYDEDKLYFSLSIDNKYRYIKEYTEDNGNLVALNTIIKGVNDGQ